MRVRNRWRSALADPRLDPELHRRERRAGLQLVAELQIERGDVLVVAGQHLLRSALMIGQRHHRDAVHEDAFGLKGCKRRGQLLQREGLAGLGGMPEVRLEAAGRVEEDDLRLRHRSGCPRGSGACGTFARAALRARRRRVRGGCLDVR